MKKSLVGRLFLLIILLLANILSFADTSANIETNEYFQQGHAYYNAKEYLNALPAFQKAVELEPTNSIYHHMLGKCYGRIAEQGNWLTALRYVRKTLSEFKKSVELDVNNVQAWVDLEEFYRRAPGFLGGDRRKAKEIRAKLDGLNIEAGTD